MKYLQRSLEFYKKKRQAQSNGRMYSQEGAVYMEQGDYSRARRSFEQALEIRMQLAEPAQSSREMRKLSRLYSRFGQIAKAQDYAQRAQALREKINDQNEILADRPGARRNSAGSERTAKSRSPARVLREPSQAKAPSGKAPRSPPTIGFSLQPASGSGQSPLLQDLRQKITGKTAGRERHGRHPKINGQRRERQGNRENTGAEAAPDHHRRAGRLPAARTGGMAGLEMEEYPTLGARPLAQP